MSFSGAAASADDFNIFLKTSPKLELLRPFADPVNMSLLVTHADGTPVMGRVAIAVDAPERGAFLSTDFPLVESSRMLELVLPLRQGRADWKYLFPIRGDYRLSVSVIAADGKANSKSFAIAVPENRQKWLWLGLFCAGLFLSGFIAGRIFTTSRASALTLLLVLFATGGVVGGDQAAPRPPADNPPGALEVEGASVGQPSRLRWRPRDGRAANTRLSVEIVHVEKRKTMFAIDKIAVAGDYRFAFHFPDGSEYRVTSLVEIPGKPPLRTQQLVAVTATEAPLTAQLPALGLFVATIALGLGAGRFSKRLPIG